MKTLQRERRPGTVVLTAKLAAGLLLIATVRQAVSLEWDATIGTARAGNLLVMTLTATLGVAIGALRRSQVAAITGSLVWMLVVEHLASTIDYRIGRWLPFPALNAMFATDQARTDSAKAGARALRVVENSPCSPWAATDPHSPDG